MNTRRWGVPIREWAPFRTIHGPQLFGHFLKDKKSAVFRSRQPAFLRAATSSPGWGVSTVGSGTVTDDLPIPAQGSYPVAVDQKRLVDTESQIPDKLLRFGGEGKTGAPE